MAEGLPNMWEALVLCTAQGGKSNLRADVDLTGNTGCVPLHRRVVFPLPMSVSGQEVRRKTSRNTLPCATWCPEALVGGWQGEVSDGAFDKSSGSRAGHMGRCTPEICGGRGWQVPPRLLWVW